MRSIQASTQSVKSQYSGVSREKLEEYASMLEKQNDARNTQRKILEQEIEFHKTEIENLLRKIAALEGYNGTVDMNIEKFVQENEKIRKQIEQARWTIKNQQTMVSNLAQKMKQLLSKYQRIAEQINPLFKPYLPEVVTYQNPHFENISDLSQLQPIEVENQVKKNIVSNLQILAGEFKKESRQMWEHIMNDVKLREIISFMEQLYNGIQLVWGVVDLAQNNIIQINRLESQNLFLKDKVIKILDNQTLLQQTLSTNLNLQNQLSDLKTKILTLERASQAPKNRFREYQNNESRKLQKLNTFSNISTNL